MSDRTSQARTPLRSGTRVLAAGVMAAGLLGLGPVSPASADAPSAAQFREMGSTSAPNYRLPPGCHRYSYTYRVNPPEPEWLLEVFITDAAGVGQASDAIASGADPRSGRKTFQLCASNTAAPGRFTIRARLTYHHYATMPVVDQEADYSGWISTSHFRVTKRHAAAPSARCRKARARARRLDTDRARLAAHRACHAR